MLAITFAEPVRLWLLLLPAALFAAYAVLQAGQRGYAVRFTNLDLLDKVAPSRPGWRRHAVAAGFLGCIALQTLAFAGPQRDEREPRERATIMLAVDVSLSMMATDVVPNRLEAAKDAAHAFLDQVPPKLNVGLVTFSGVAVVKVAPTQDRLLLRDALDTLELGEGTAIGDAIIASLQGIATVPPDEEGSPPPAVIILMSDGTTTRGTPDAIAAERAIAASVPVSTIAFGTPTGTITIPQEPRPIPVPVDRDALRTIARSTGGQAYDAQTTQELRAVYQGIGSSIGFVTVARSIVGWFIGLALVAALVTAVGSLVWFSRLP